MVDLAQYLTAYRRIGLDSAIFIYHFEAHSTYLPLTTTVLSRLERGQFSGVTSTVTLMEITVHPRRAERADITREYETLLVHFPHLTMADVTREVARKAAQLRAEYGIHAADALQVATAIVNGAGLWLTNDKRLQQLASEIEILVLADWVNVT